MEVTILKHDGTEAGRTAQLSEAVFGIEPNDHAIWLDVRRIQAAARQGTHKTKERGEVAGSTRKLYRQKGTGHARAGSAKSPIRKSGGRIFGPRPRNYDLKVNRKTQRLARRSALTYKAQGEAIRLVESLGVEAISTKSVSAMLAAHGATGRKALILTDGLDRALYRSARNLPKVKVMPATDASTVDLLDAQVILLQEGALDSLTAQLTK
jgi:large subunit ribosomal protein L4